MIYVIAKCPCHEEGASKLIDWAKGDDGFSVTRTHKGFKHIELLVDEDNKTIYLYEQWDTKEEHQAKSCLRHPNFIRQRCFKEMHECSCCRAIFSNCP